MIKHSYKKFIIAVVSIFVYVYYAQAADNRVYQLEKAMTSYSPKVKTYIDTLYKMKYTKKLPQPTAIAKLCASFQHIKKQWHYTNDPGNIDYIAPPEITINSGMVGDCDDFAVLMYTIIELLGKRSRVVFAYEKKGTRHAFAELFLCKNKISLKEKVGEIIKNYAMIYDETSEFKVYVRRDLKGYWFNFDWFAEYPSGKYYDSSKEIMIYGDGDAELLEGENLPQKVEITVKVSRGSGE
ncbi:MAG: transglutaminase domain-containing protein [Candidatus Omnitrophota bacterium]